MSIYWRATHSTGLILNSKQGATYRDIDRETVAFFDLWSGENLLIRVDLRPDDLPRRRLIYRQRTQMTTAGDKLSFYLVGWQRTVGGQNIQAICYIVNGSVVLGGQFDEADPIMYSIQPEPQELDLLAA